MNLSEIINHVGEDRENYFGAMSPPIIQTSNFKFENVDLFRKAMLSELDDHVYTRGNNPTVEILRKKMAALEGAEDSLVLSSGVSAISMAVLSVLKAGDHAICVNHVYGWTDTLFNRILPRFGVSTTFVDGKDVENFRNAILPNTALIYMESPNTMLFELQDIEEVSKLAKSKGITTIIENTYCTPLYQRPIEYGVDIVVHTATKYLSGHSDVVAGVICTSRERIAQIFANQLLAFGPIVSPNDAWLIIRGLRTLEIRLERISNSAKQVIGFLENHPKVSCVHYPFSTQSPQLDLAKKQMKGMGGLFSFELKTKDVSQIELFCNSLKFFSLAVSWGGYESLVFPVCASYYACDKGRDNAFPINLIRLYVALEDPNLLIDDLASALMLID